MKLIVGFGNPGDQYNFSRHNFGFLALDFYFKTHSLAWQSQPKFNAIWQKVNDTIFIKPQTFYNDVGQSIQAFANFYKIPPADICVICDDFAIEFGQLRYRTKGSAGGNNGLKSTIQYLKTEDFPRLRLGTANDVLRQRIGDTNFVLGKFTLKERQDLPATLSTISAKIDGIIAN